MNTTTTARPASAFAKNASMIAKRAAHPLNDKLVRLARDDARAKSTTTTGGDVVGTGITGYVWAVQGDKALCDFGPDLRVVAMVADLVLA